jgi:hypothetical protein
MNQERPQPTDTADEALLALPTGEIRLAPSFVDGLRAIAPRPRRRKIRSLIALGAMLTAALAFVAPVRVRTVAMLRGGWTRAVAQIEAPAGASELAAKPAPAAIQVDPPTPPVATGASVEHPVGSAPTALAMNPPKTPKKLRRRLPPK